MAEENAKCTKDVKERREDTQLLCTIFLLRRATMNAQYQNMNQKDSFIPKGAVSRQHQAAHTHSSCTVWTEVETSVHGWSRTLRVRVQGSLEDTLTDAPLARHYIL